jgi:ATP-binding cassette subfamily B multidrug efflux pump
MKTFKDAPILKRIVALVRPYRRRFAWTGVLVMVLALLSWVRPYLIRLAIDEKVAAGDREGLLAIFVAVVGLVVIEAALQFFQTYWANWVAQSVTFDLRERLFAHVLNFRLAYFDKTPVGQLVTRHVSDIDGISNVFSNGLLNAVGDILRLLVVVVAMLLVDWELALVVLAPVPVLVWATRIFQKAIKSSFVAVRNEVSRINVFVQEHVTGMGVVQAFHREAAESAKFDVHNAAHRDANIRSVWAFSVFFPVVEMLSATSVALLLWWGVDGVAAGKMSLGVVLQFVLYVFMLYRPIRQLADRFNVLQMGIVNGQRVFALLDRQELMPISTALDDASGDHDAFTFVGRVVFEDVWFAYNDEDWVLRGVSFEVAAGETVAFVGATGAGKSSIIALMSRFYAHQKGRITIDGRDISAVPLPALRNGLCVVPQDVFLFSGTLRENISLFDEGYSLEQVKDAAESVGAAAFIEQLPGGYNYDVRERGLMLSTGQRQLIAFTRAYIRNPAVLILDEATSSIDSESEAMIQRATARLTQGRTSVVVAHRLSTIRDAQQILVLDAGCIVERGSHSSLLALNGFYHRLFQLQLTDLS